MVNHSDAGNHPTMTKPLTILDLMVIETGCHHPDQTHTDTNGDPCCTDCHTEWATHPDQR